MEERVGERRYVFSLAWATSWWPGRLRAQLLQPWRHEAVILFLSHYFDTPGPPVQFLPDFQQHAISILSPLMIPESQLFDPVRRENFCPFLIALEMFRQAVLETVQFHRQPSGRTVEVQKVLSVWVLAAELEARK